MLATFQGFIRDGDLVVDELRDSRLLEDKHVAVVPLELNKRKEVVGGSVLAGVYREGHLESSSDRSLHDFEGQQVMVVVRHEVLGRMTADEFDNKYQLGAKPGDLDD